MFSLLYLLNIKCRVATAGNSSSDESKAEMKIVQQNMVETRKIGCAEVLIELERLAKDFNFATGRLTAL